MKASPNKGVLISAKPIISLLSSWIRFAAKNIPKKLLPTSPIKTFAGGKFQNKKVDREPKRMLREFAEFNLKFMLKKITNIHPATNPSDPSIKWVKFIHAVMMIISKNIINIFMKE